MRAVRALLAGVVVLALAGCGERLPAAAPETRVLAARDETQGGIVQSVFLSAVELRRGERLRIESRIPTRGRCRRWW